VLLKPPFKESTLALWLGPFFLLGLAASLAASYTLRNLAEAGNTKPLSKEEQERLAWLTGNTNPGNKEI